MQILKKLNNTLIAFVSFFMISHIVCAQNSMDNAVLRPNVVIILTDDQGWGDLSISGNTNLKTPHIDRLAKTGVTFDKFYVSPVCSPTRAELLTGRYHPRGGIYSTSTGGERLDLDEETMANYFKRAGYNTACYGKWHNGMQPPYHPNARGFDDFYGFCSGHWANYFNPMLEHNGEIVNGNGFVINDFTDRGLNFIEQNKKEPFFLYMAFNTPHSPMQVPDRWYNKFKNKELKMLHHEPEKEDIPFTRAALAMCENIDWNVGRIVEKIEKLGLNESTIIVFLSDNGPNSWRWNKGMKGKKGSTDEGGVRVPMFIKWEGVLPSGETIEKIAGAIDLLPTLADMTGIDFQPKKSLDGISLKPLLNETTPNWNERFIYSFWNGLTSVRSQQFRLDGKGRLYDMKNGSTQSIVVNSKFPNIANQMIKAKQKWEKEVLSELANEDARPLTIGPSGYPYNHFPARDGTAHGDIERSSRWPNASFFTNWKSLSDSITWEIEVLEEGDFDVEIYYTCLPEAVGSVIELSFAQEKIAKTISVSHNPPLKGMEQDRVKRIESYTKDFKAIEMGNIHLSKGKGLLTLKALEIPNDQVIDFRLLIFKRK
jgi:arylsulfatase A-like enzyme